MYLASIMAKFQQIWWERFPSVKSTEYANNQVKKLVINKCYNPSKIIKYCILQDEQWQSPFRLPLLSVTQANY